MSELTFRPIDVQRHGELCVRFRRDSYACSFGTDAFFYEQFGSDTEYLEWLRARVQACPDGVAHLWRGDRIIGQTEMAIRLAPAPASVNLFYLVPHERGSGAGATLHAHIVGVLRTRGAEVAQLHVASGNTRALRFYEKHGWRERVGMGRSDPPVLLMQLDLGIGIASA